jgi:iron complex outermembrane receptor protein
VDSVAAPQLACRGLRVIQDGIPATMPDGQGQLSHIPLEALAHVDVLRGTVLGAVRQRLGCVVEFSSADPPAHPAFACTPRR